MYAIFAEAKVRPSGPRPLPPALRPHCQPCCGAGHGRLALRTRRRCEPARSRRTLGSPLCREPGAKQGPHTHTRAHARAFRRTLTFFLASSAGGQDAARSQGRHGPSRSGPPHGAALLHDQREQPHPAVALQTRGCEPPGTHPERIRCRRHDPAGTPATFQGFLFWLPLPPTHSTFGCRRCGA